MAEPDSQPESVYCKLPRCREKRQRRGGHSDRFLYSVQWQVFYVNNVAVPAFELTITCPDCGAIHTRLHLQPT